MNIVTLLLLYNRNINNGDVMISIGCYQFTVTTCMQIWYIRTEITEINIITL